KHQKRHTVRAADQAFSSSTARATSLEAIFSHAFLASSSKVWGSRRPSYSFRETSRLMFAYCSDVSSCARQ
ncbi:hypothetical protein CSPAE12_08048, partial [Colletotrichum incanum]